MTLRLGGDGAITGCTSLEEPTLSVSGLLVTTPIVATSGTVAAPSYTFTGDTNTGFYQPNGDAIGVSLAGVERAILDSSSNNSWLLIKSTASTGDSAELFLGNSYSEGSISYSHGTGNTNRNLMFKTAGTEKMRLDSYGNLGLGVSPNNVNNFKTFTLNGTTGGNIEFQDQGTLIGSIYNLADQFIIQGQGSTIPVAFRTNSTERMRIAADGNVGIGKSNPNTTFEIYEDTNPYIYLQNSTTGTTATDGFSIVEFGLDAYINNREAGNMIFYNNGSERMRIDSSGNIAIGTTSPTAFGPTLQVAGTDPCFLLQDTANAVDYFGTNIGSGLVTNWYDDAAAWRIGTATGIAGSSYSEKMRIDSSGNVGIGISDPGTMLQVANSSDDGNIRVGGNNSGTTGLTISYSNGGSTATTILQNYRSTNSDALLKFDAGYLTFHTGTSGSERMRIYSSGFIGIGTTAAEPHSGSYNGSGLQIHNETTGKGVNLRLTCDVTGAGAGGGSYLAVDGVNRSFYIYNKESAPIIFGPGNSEKARISSGGKLTVPGVYSNTTTGGSAVYVESDGDLLRFTSSLKYKTDIETLEDVRADAILNCRPVWYRSKCANDIKTEGSDKSDWGWYGFIAEEVAEIEPRLVNWATKNAVLQEDGTNKTVERDPADYEAEGVRYENFVPLLVNLVKRQQIAIETLQAKVAALET